MRLVLKWEIYKADDQEYDGVVMKRRNIIEKSHIGLKSGGHDSNV